MKQRNFALDIIRSLACLLVIIYHSAKPGVVNQYEAIGTALIGVPCIGLFFMVSGYLLLPTKESLLPFMKRRMKRILSPLLVWTAFYMLVTFIQEDAHDVHSWLRSILSLPFSRQGHGVLWFLYTITGLYILSPILSAWLEKATKLEVQFLLVLWGITLCYPYLRPFVTLTEDTYSMYYYFSGFAGYFLLGYYVKRFQPSLPMIGILAFYFVPVALAVLSKFANINLIYHSFEYLSLLVMMMVLGLFLFIHRITFQSQMSSFWSRVVVNFSNCSFGIYLIHIFVMRSILWNVDILSQYGGLVQILSSVILTTVVSWIVVYLISMFPYGEYIVGYKTKHK